MTEHTQHHPILWVVAQAFADANPKAGRASAKDADRSRDARADRLIRCGYVRLGGYAGTNAIATVVGERQGGADDCTPPVDYYADAWPLLETPGLWWEWYDAAAGNVYFDGSAV